jgi:SAM-dependent methyltransferase
MVVPDRQAGQPSIVAHKPNAAIAELRAIGLELPVFTLMDTKWIQSCPTYNAGEPTMAIPDRSTFENIYAGQPPWEIGRPQKAFLNAADEISGSVLEVGCGTGENALFFASRGHKVTGIDFLAEPIKRARQKCAERGLTATFLVMDALQLHELPEVFDSAIDSGLFHVFSDEDRRRYVAGLASVLKHGGRMFLLCFSDAEPGDQGPRRISRQEIDDAFAQGWKVESIEPSRFEVLPNLKEFHFSEGGPKAWFVVASRIL